jgi:hypothetical protein
MKEFWRKIKDSMFYQVSNLGNIRVKQRFNYLDKDTPEFRPIPCHHNAQGYMEARIETYSGFEVFSVHRLVCAAFQRNPLGKPHVNHKNGIKDDNRNVNLEWCTQAENSAHASRIGLLPGGKLYTKSKLTIETASLIYALNLVRAKKAFLARLFNVSYATVNNICQKRTWHKRILAYCMKYKRYRPKPVINTVPQRTDVLDLCA